MILNRLFKKSIDLYYISTSPDLDKKVIYPKIPNTLMVNNKIKDWKTKRICLYPSIDKALTSLDQNLSNMILYIYSPIDVRKESLYKPNIVEVPEKSITEEYWYLAPIQLKLLGKIEVKDKILPSMKYRYGKRQLEHDLFKWKWEEVLKPWERSKFN